jgi:hypothetical protein
MACVFFLSAEILKKDEFVRKVFIEAEKEAYDSL